MIRPSNRYIASGLVAALLVTGQTVGHAQERGSRATLSVGRVGGTSVPGAPAVSPEYRIGVEDVLDIVVWGNADLTVRGVQVRPDGRVSLPIVNDLMAVGLTAMDLRTAIIKRLEGPFHDQEVSVTVREVNSLKFSVVGLVRSPNRYPLRSQLTVLDAIAMAGGFAEFAQRQKMYVLRNGKRLPFNYDKFVNDPSGQENIILQSGDTVVIPG